MTFARALLLFAGTALCAPQPALASGIAAIVEQVSGPAGGLGEMELLEEGRVIELGKGASLTLGYPATCLRETITGGRVTIGAEKSQVSGGTVNAEKVDCDAGRILSVKQSADVAGTVYRKGVFGDAGSPEADRILYGVSPAIRFSSAVRSLKIERLDEPGDPLVLPVGSAQVDLAARGVTLEPSGLYALSADGKPVIVRISPQAKGGAPLLSRLILM